LGVGSPIGDGDPWGLSRIPIVPTNWDGESDSIGWGLYFTSVEWNNPTPNPTIGGVYGKATGKAFQLALKADCAKFLQSVMQGAFLLENGLSLNSSPNALTPQTQTMYNNIQGINAAQLASSAYLVNMTNVNVTKGSYTINAQTRGSQIGGDGTLFLYQGFANKGLTGQAQVILHEGTHLLANASDNQLAAAAGVPNAMSISQSQASAAYQAQLERKCK